MPIKLLVKSIILSYLSTKTIRRYSRLAFVCSRKIQSVEHKDGSGAILGWDAIQVHLWSANDES